MVSTVKIDIPSRGTQAEIDALTNVPAGSSIFNTTTTKANISQEGGASPIFSNYDMQFSYSNGSVVDLNENQNIEISSFEQSVASIVSIDNPGIGYNAGDIVASSGGTHTEIAQFIIDTVDGSGQVTSISIIEEGNYTVPPTNPVSVSGGVGDGLSINLSFQNKNPSSQSYFLNMPAGLCLGRNNSIPDYAIADLGSTTVGDKRAVLLGSLTNAEESRLISKSPANSVLWYNSDIGRFKTSLSSVAKTVVIGDDLPTIQAATYGEMYFTNNTTSTVIVSPATPVKVAGAYLGGLNANFIHAAGSLILTGPGGVYKISADLSCAIPGGTSTICAFIYINGVKQNKAVAQQYIGPAVDSVHHFHLEILQSLSTSNSIEIRIQDDLSNNSITVAQFHCTINRETTYVF